MLNPNQSQLLQKIYQTSYATLYQTLIRQGTLPTQNAKVLETCALWRWYWEPEAFARSFFPEYCRKPFSRMHSELFTLWYRKIRRGKKTVVVAPRGHAKSTLMLLIQVLHAICYRYEPFIIIVAQNQQAAEKWVQQVLDELRSNERIISMFGELAPPRGQGSKKSFTTQNGVHVQAISRGQSPRGLNVRGNRPSLIILDDIETLEGVQNAEQRDKTQEWFLKDVLPLAQTDGSTNVVVIGTLLHDESLLAFLMGQPDWEQRKYQAIESWAVNEPEWEEWRGIYTDLSNPNREADSDTFFAENEESMLEGTQVLWPENEPYLDLQKKLISLGRKAFYSEKQNEPFNSSDQLFDLDAAAYFDYDPTTQTIRCIETGRTVRRQDLHTVVAFHDPATGESDTGDYAAIVVVGRDYNGYFYVLDAFLERCKPNQQIEAAARLHERWQIDILYIESNQFQVTLYDQHVTQFADQAQPPKIRKMHQNGDKVDRIAQLQTWVENGHMLFNKALPAEFFRQLKYFPTLTHDDGPDALEGATSQLLRRNGATAPPSQRPSPKRRNPTRR